MTLSELGEVYHKHGNETEAFAHFQRALAIAEKVLKPDHPDMITILPPLAQLYRDQGQYTEALPLYQRILTIQETILGTEHPTTTKTRENITDLLNKTGTSTP